MLYRIVNLLYCSNQMNINFTLQFIIQAISYDNSVMQLLSNYIIDHTLYIIEYLDNQSIRKTVLNIIKVYLNHSDYVQLIFNHYIPFIRRNLNINNTKLNNYEQNQEVLFIIHIFILECSRNILINAEQ